LERRLGGPQIRSGHGGGIQNFGWELHAKCRDIDGRIILKWMLKKPGS
jgi:hypothetical protein